jgi:pimeloyl-ACP methyl ester carboxylesterase
MAISRASCACIPLLLLCSLAVTQTVQAEPGARTASTLQLEPCELRGSQGYGRVDAQCGTLAVAENREAPDGRTIELFVARIPALKPDPAADAFMVINGGPGASSVDLYVGLQGAFAPVRLERDIIIVDQRGTGRSAPLECSLPEQPLTAFDESATTAATRLCLDTLNADPRFYTTSIAVQDLEQVREALGYRQWTLYGVSYGTRVAQHYLRRYPDAVRALVLDGVLPPDQALGPDIALNAQLALDAVFARCADEPACAARFPEPARQFERLASRLRQTPESVALPDPVTAAPQTTSLSYGHLASTVRMLSYAPETAALLPLMVDEAEARGNYTPLALQANRIEQELGDAINLAMHNTVVCTEDVPYYAGLEALRPDLERAYLGTDQVRMLQTICAQWPQGPIDADLRTPLRADTPVLLLSGEHDPVTPPDYAERAAAHLTASLHIVAPGQGHGVIARGCLPEIVGDFVRAGRRDALDAGCVARLAADPFFVDLMGPPP